MERKVYDSSSLTMETDPKTDTFTRTIIDDTIVARLLSVRCQDAQTQTLPNQDYASVVYYRDAASLCFCVCDGVGSSYKGDFAARYLATTLVQWLRDLTELQQDPAVLSAKLRAQLDSWACAAQIKLRQIALAADTPRLVREVLEELRDDYGSEAVFMGGRIDYGAWSTDLSVSHPTEALFCWMGNVSGLLSITPDHYIQLGDMGSDAHRWSTARGCRGAVTTWGLTLSTIDRLIVYTDGLDSVGSALASSSDEEWQRYSEQLLRHPANDDMTALDLHWVRTHMLEEHSS